jgi:hypothetical protein
MLSWRKRAHFAHSMCDFANIRKISILFCAQNVSFAGALQAFCLDLAAFCVGYVCTCLYYAAAVPVMHAQAMQMQSHDAAA